MGKNTAPFTTGDRVRELKDGQPGEIEYIVSYCWFDYEEKEWLINLGGDMDCCQAKDFVGVDLEITHLIVRIPEAGVWVLLAFFTHFKGGKRYFFGLDAGGRALDADEVEVSNVVELAKYCKIKLGQLLWLSMDTIWLADAADPRGDDKREKIADVEVLDFGKNHARLKIRGLV